MNGGVRPVLIVIQNRQSYRTAVRGHGLHDEEALGRAGSQVRPVVRAIEAAHGGRHHELRSEENETARGRDLGDGQHGGGGVSSAGVVDLE